MSLLCTSTAPPLWPERFVLTQRRFPIDWTNRTADATITTYYDAKRAANLIHIVADNAPNTTLWDLELNDKHSYYFDPQAKQCKTITFPVGILRQNWLANATSLGSKYIRGRKAVGWTKVDFIDYWADEQTCEPLSWTVCSPRLSPHRPSPSPLTYSLLADD